MTTAVAAPVATVRECRRSGRYRILSLDAPHVAKTVQPGQFVMIEQRAPGHLLRRPFSVLDQDGDAIEIGFDAIGEGTAWIAARTTGDTLVVDGPLGNAYGDPPERGTALLVGGGYGSAPLIFFAKRLRDKGVRTHLILGAASEDRLFERDRGERYADAVTITTDDGSAGIRGRVTDAMAGIDASAVYACGPMPMLAAVARAAHPDVRVEVAVEEFMACGIGVCWTCVVPTHEEGYGKHRRSCIDGPVFDGRAIKWA